MTTRIDVAVDASYSAMPMAAKKNTAKFSAMIAIRVLPEDDERLDVLAERLPFVTRHQLARAALKIGLSALEADPKRLVDEEMVKTPARKAPTRRPRGSS